MSDANHRMKTWIAGFAIRCLVCITLFVGAAVAPGSPRGPGKPVLAHYMPWFVAPPQSPTWGFHWTMNSQNPDSIDGSGHRQIAGHHYPRIGPYDSADPVVLEYHVLLMKLAGIDGVIVDWYGPDDVHDFAVNEARTLALLDYTRNAGLKFCLCYEDSTVQAAIDTGSIHASDAIAAGQETMLHAQRRYFNDPGYLRLANGQPVLLNFGPQFFKTARQWTGLFSVLDGTNQPAFFTQDHRLPVGAGAFNWPPMHLSRTNGGVLSMQALESYLDGFEQSGSRWPAFISSAFPRFHDFYQQGGVGASHGSLADDGGATFRFTLARAMTNDSSMVQLVTWNDFGEGTIIEPTVQYGYRDLGVIQDLRRQYFDPGFPCGTNELHLATRLYALRRLHASNPALSAKLDGVFATIVAGKLDLAALHLNGLESNPPVIDDFSASNTLFAVSMAGSASEPGLDRVGTSGLLAARKTVVSSAAVTNAINLPTPVVQEPLLQSSRVRTSGP